MQLHPEHAADLVEAVAALADDELQSVRDGALRIAGEIAVEHEAPAAARLSGFWRAVGLLADDEQARRAEMLERARVALDLDGTACGSFLGAVD